MGYLQTIVNYINDAIAGLCDNKKIIGIAQGMPRTNGDKIEIFPSYVNDDGEGVYVGPDDDFDLITYHKVNSIIASKGRLKSSYGDDGLHDVHSARISLVVFGRRDKLRMSNDEVAVQIHSLFPEAATKEMIKSMQLRAANINVKDINLNDMQVFAEEYQNVPFFLKPEQFLFKLNYNIESAFLKRCFTNKC